MTDHHVTCRHCGVGINYRCDHEDSDVPAEDFAALKGENAQLIEVYDHAQTGLKSMRAEAGKMREEIAYLKARSERDMCADGHERIRYTPDEEFGPCPVCVLRAENSTQGRLLALKDGEIAALKGEIHNLRASLAIPEYEAEIAALKQAAREYEHYVMTGRDDQHERLVSERDALKAEVERPRCNDLLCRCCARRAR